MTPGATAEHGFRSWSAQAYASEAEELADLIADNRLSELAELDEAALTGLLRELRTVAHDLQLAGFTGADVAKLLDVEVETARLETIPQMEMQAFEHYDYLCFMFRDIRDWLRAIQLVGVGRVNRNLSPAETAAMVENVAWSAQGAGARLFGWNQRPDPRVLQRNDPFSVVHWCGGVLGVVGKEVSWDEMLRFKCDIDCCLGELLRNRIIWHESRFCFLQARDKNLGGNSRFRSPERIAAEKRYLQSKWKAHLRLDTYQSQDRVQVAVERRQRVEL